MRSVEEFRALKKEGQVEEVIFSTWQSELEKHPEAIEYITSEGIVVIFNEEPKVNSGSAFHQMKSLHIGLDNIKNKNNYIFKTRPDLYISGKYVKKIASLNYDIETEKSPFSNKIWVPWFEISKPFYLADECFYCCYSDALKLVNYNTIYDNYFDIDAGITHIRRFYEPFFYIYKEFHHYFKVFGETGHGTELRFEIFEMLKGNHNYNALIQLYYKVLKDNFLIGLDESGYIEFREWNESASRPNLSNFHGSIRPENSFCPSKGQIYSYDLSYIDCEIENNVIQLGEDVTLKDDIKLKKDIMIALSTLKKAPLALRIKRKLVNVILNYRLSAKQ
ncbi:hypothetical protein [Vibrio atlanticus]|uniref:hypothetical protein n=1 Tax=Vibrio atlanticus TaxID=693153 RepID=UPI003553893A